VTDQKQAVVAAKPRIRLTAASVASVASSGQAFGSRILAEAARGFEVLWQDAEGDLHEQREWAQMAWTLIRQNPMAISAMNTLTTNVIGTGLKLQAAIRRDALRRKGVGWTDQQFDDLEMQIEDDFREWAEDKDKCDAHGQLNWYQQQALCYQSKIVAGDGIALLSSVKRRFSPVRLRSQIVHPARLSNPNGGPNTTTMSFGIERDRLGYRTRYHFQDAHPDSANMDANSLRWTGVPVRGARTGRPNVVHMFKPLEPGAVRGMSALRPIVKIAKQSSRFTEATVAAAVIHAVLSVMFENGSASDFGHGNNAEGTANNEIELRDGSGMMLPDGVKPHLVQATQPGPHIEQFMNYMMRFGGMAVGVPQEVLTKQFQSSYSAARGALNEFWKDVRTGRGDVTSDNCRPTYHAFLLERVVDGVYDMPGFMTDMSMRSNWCGSEWLGPPRGMIDKNKEIMPEFEMYRYNAKPLSTISEELTEVPFRATVQRIARDKALLSRFDLQDAQNAPRLLDAILDEQEKLGFPTNDDPDDGTQNPEEDDE